MNLRRKLEVSTRRVSDYKRLVMAIATNDAPRITQIVSTALRQRSSVLAIIKKITSAAAGVFHNRTYNDDDLDLAYLVKSLGGPKLLYAMARAFGLPSLSTLLRNRKVPTLVPSIGRPSISEISENISSFFGSEAVPCPPSAFWSCLDV